MVVADPSAQGKLYRLPERLHTAATAQALFCNWIAKTVEPLEVMVALIKAD